MIYSNQSDSISPIFLYDHNQSDSISPIFFYDHHSLPSDHDPHSQVQALRSLQELTYSGLEERYMCRKLALLPM